MREIVPHLFSCTFLWLDVHGQMILESIDTLYNAYISKTWASSFGSLSHGRWSFEHLFESSSHSRNLSWSLSIFRSLAFHNEASCMYLGFSVIIYRIQHRHSLAFPHCNHCCCNQISCLQCA